MITGIGKLFSVKKSAVTAAELTFEEALGKTVEGAEAAEACGYDVELLHCHGCINSCRLSQPRCALGEQVAGKLKLKKAQ